MIVMHGRYRTTKEEDDAVVADPTSAPRERVAARLLRIEKSILTGTASICVIGWSVRYNYVAL